jgi:hypothetical protein
MISYPLYDLSEDEFEQLTNMVCQKILGMGVISFSKGKDGGKDGRFKGTAEKFPSKKSPWSGKFIIQSKHTNKLNASCSDADFKTIIDKEIKRIIKIKKKEGLDVYIIFTNRKHTGNVGDDLIKRMKFEIKIDLIEIIGLETLTTYLRQSEEIVNKFELENLKNPLRIHPNDLVDVITSFDKNKKKLDGRKITDPFKHVNKTTKNNINNLNKDYFEYIKDRSNIYFDEITKFLGDKKNKEYLEKYNNIIDELQAKIITNRSDFIEFNEIFEYYYDFILDRSPDIQNKRLIRVMLHFMYWNCDIGKDK